LAARFDRAILRDMGAVEVPSVMKHAARPHARPYGNFLVSCMVMAMMVRAFSEHPRKLGLAHHCPFNAPPVLLRGAPREGDSPLIHPVRYVF
jgi:hypothetical protein